MHIQMPYAYQLYMCITQNGFFLICCGMIRCGTSVRNYTTHIHTQYSLTWVVAWHTKIQKSTIWLFNSSPWYRWPIEIDALPIKNGGSFYGYVKYPVVSARPSSGLLFPPRSFSTSLDTRSAGPRYRRRYNLQTSLVAVSNVPKSLRVDSQPSPIKKIWE